MNIGSVFLINIDLMIISVMTNKVLPRGRSTEIPKTRRDQQLSPSSAPLNGNNKIFLGFEALFI